MGLNRGMKTVLTTLLAICVCLVIGCGEQRDRGERTQSEPVEVAAEEDKEYVEFLKAMAEKGDAERQFYLGVLYNTGQGVEKDDKEAVKWFRKAAEHGFAPAQVNLGGMYDDGKGVLEDDKEAVKWFRKAAEHGFAPAQHNLGVMYGKGEGVLQDIVTAYAWLNISAANGQEKAKKFKDLAANEMTPDQIAKAEALVKEMVKKNPKLLNNKD